jgi:dodecin
LIHALIDEGMLDQAMVQRILSAGMSRCYARVAAGAPASCLNQREDDMAESVYKVIELIGTSKDSWEKAATAAVARAGKSLRDLRVAEVVTLDLQLDAKGKVEAYRAKLKVSFKFEG